MISAPAGASAPSYRSRRCGPDPCRSPTLCDMTEQATEVEVNPHEVPGVGHRWRRVLVIVLAVLTCLSILTSTVGVWAHRTLLNTNSWVNAVGPLASNPQITDAVAVQLTNELMKVINADEVAQNALPEQAKFLAAPLTAAVGQFVERAVQELLKTDQFQTFWVEANRRVHTLAVNVLRGDTKGVTTADGTVQLNLLPLIAEALSFVQSKAPGLVADGKPIPKITVDTPVDQARSDLSSATGRTLPGSFGVVTVFQSDKLKAAQDAVTLFDRAVTVLLVVTLLLLVATIALALDRRRIIIGLALGTVAAFGLALAIIGAIKGQVLDLIVDPQARAAANDMVSTLVGRLHLLTNAFIALGLAVALIAFVTGASRPAVAIRAWASLVTRYLGGKVDRDGAPAAMIWMQDHVNELRWGALVVGFGLLVFVVNGWWGLFLTVLVIGLFEAALTYAAAQRAGPASPPVAAG